MDRPINYIRELDGLRGIAILLVILGHIELINGPFLPTINNISSKPEELFWYITKFGWIGVDLFFVISGYLITKIIITQINSPKDALNFFARRFIRIYPLFTIFLASYLIATQLIPALNIAGSKFQFYFNHQWHLWLQISNFLRENGVFPQGELMHLWSLAIEEQFYLVMPLMLLLLRALSPRHHGLTFLGLILILLISIIFYKIFILDFNIISPLNMYVSTFLRAESLISGSALALVEHYASLRIKQRIKYLGFPLIILGGIIFIYTVIVSHRESPIAAFDMYFTAYRHLIQRYGFSSLSICFTGVLIYTIYSPEKSWFKNLLGQKLLINFGKYSYSLYMLNTLVIALFTGSGFSWFWFRAKLGYGFLPIYLILILASCWLLAQLTWLGIEEPFLKLKKYKFFKYGKSTLDLLPVKK